MKKYKIEDMTFYSNLWDKVEPNWGHVWLLGQVLFVINAVMWSVGQPISLLVIAVAATWLIAVTQKI